ncbi:hypothetical protein 23F_00068 [Ralstonia phage Gerry]|uniref:Uncharacterized protein n=1 Tax=Ralstonia phage Gerry TaxID=2759727 RepID=A0A7G5BAA5_9CAUD|nr:hypothetical protein KMC47_gp55 [Ralstonia phage Gerry]QMV33228.1 hypothetical protein 23F_00068 [Ralstonia phage Gerry]
MKITKDQLRAWSACADGYGWFLRRFPEGEAEYQDVLNALAKDDRPDDAHWLMNLAGADKTAVLELEFVADCKYLFVAGSLIVKGAISVSKWLRAGCGIEAGEGIEAGWGIKAGEGIEAGCGIEAGWGIKAGEGIKAGCGIEAGCGIKAGEGIEAGCGIKAGWGIEAGCGIKAGCGIEAGEGIKAGCGIEAGWGIKAGEGIEAGEEFGVFAGLRVRLPTWSLYARVIAKTKPKNLIGGAWVEEAAEKKEAAEPHQGA